VTDSLILGSVVFENFELPPKVNFGGIQRLVTHTLGDGRRIVDRLGPDDSDIQFQGTFSGPNAVNKASVLDAMRTSGHRVTLSWGTLFFPVIVRRFSANFENSYWIPYAITCVKVGTGGAYATSDTQGVLDSVLSDLQTIAEIGNIEGPATVGATVALGEPGATVYGTAAYDSAISLTTSAVNSCQRICQTVDLELATAGANNVLDLPRAPTALHAVADGSYRLWQLSTATGYWAQIEKNLQNAST
jgi:hypothetical protein